VFNTLSFYVVLEGIANKLTSSVATDGFAALTSLVFSLCNVVLDALSNRETCLVFEAVYVIPSTVIVVYGQEISFAVCTGDACRSKEVDMDPGKRVSSSFRVKMSRLSLPTTLNASSAL
jgi:hypothetical protein